MSGTNAFEFVFKSVAQLVIFMAYDHAGSFSVCSGFIPYLTCNLCESETNVADINRHFSFQQYLSHAGIHAR